MSADPRWFTAHSRKSRQAPRVVAVAAQLGLPVLPWQRRVLETALERVDGRPAFRDVVVSVPRQSGKSTLALALIVERMLSAPRSRILYSAQTRSAAREKMLSSWWPRLLGSPLAERFKLFRGFGAETITCDNGSQLQLLSATESAGHGETTDLVIVDEAWVHVDARVEQSVRPTMATRRDAQFWIMSTAGTARSAWWKKKLDAGRAAAEMGIVDGTACFDWSAADEVNPADEATWRSCMPALGRLIDVATVRVDLSNMPLPEFRRAYLNQWPEQTEEGWHVIPRDVWEAARDGA